MILVWLQGSLCIAGLMCSTYFPAFVTRAKPFLTFASLLDTCACVGASLASNSDTARSSIGAAVLVPVRPLVTQWRLLHTAIIFMCSRVPSGDSLQHKTCSSFWDGISHNLYVWHYLLPMAA